jgi:hypothetical protein
VHRGHRRPVPTLVLAAAVVAALAVGGCGLRPDDKPQAISRDQLDPTLFQDKAPGSVGSGTTKIYVLNNQGREPRLEAVPVLVDTGDRYRSLLEALLAWTTPSEGPFARYSSLIPHDTTLRAVRRDGDLLEVDLSNLIVEGPGQSAAVAHLVYTATDLPGIRAVRLLINGKPVAVSLGDKSSEAGARLGRGDLRDFDPEQPDDPATGMTGSTTGTSEPPTTTPTPAGVGVR